MYIPMRNGDPIVFFFFFFSLVVLGSSNVAFGPQPGKFFSN